MTYKTILVHLNDERRAGHLLGYAAALARHFSAHLIGLHVFPNFHLSPPIALPFGGDIAERIRSDIKGEIERIKSVFDGIAKDQPFTTEWRSITAGGLNVADAVLKQSLAADLVIASQSDPDWSFSDVFDCADRLAIESGRPVLVVPNAGRFDKMPRAVAVAWKARRESARALFDALPLLQAASRVHVLTVDDGSQDQGDGGGPAEIVATLARHKVTATVGQYPASEHSTAEEISIRAAEQAADLVVMGAYGHSRWREFAFGGVTRALLRDMPVPVLFSH